MEIHRDRDGRRGIQWRRNTVFAEVFQKYISAKGVSRRKHRSFVAICPQGFQEIANIVGFASVVTAWQPVPVITAVAKMKYSRPPAPAPRC